MKNIAVLGSTGTIGKNTLEVVRQFPGKYNIIGLGVNDNIQGLELQIRAFQPEVAVVCNASAAEKLRKKNLPVEILTGEEGLIELAVHPSVDMVVSAIVGSAALMPTLAAVKAGKNIALASKEILVMAGAIVMEEAVKNGATVIPVDSEHSAVFQCLDGRSGDEIRKIILTASGGPFLKKDLSELKDVTPDIALKHPNWVMGRKISIDSATLMNKGMEVIEAYWLFQLPIEKIDVLLHPQSIVHSMVEFIDGSVIAQMSVPDMKGPISYALSYPERLENVLPPLDLAAIAELTFEKPDLNKFRALSLTFDALQAGGTMPSVLNASNEIAVDGFLERAIPFTEIPTVVEYTMKQHEVSDGKKIEEIVYASNWAKEKAREIIQSYK